jgi:hypothetical protein
VHGSETLVGPVHASTPPTLLHVTGPLQPSNAQNSGITHRDELARMSLYNPEGESCQKKDVMPAYMYDEFLA